MTREEDLVALLRRYLRQETLDPLRATGRTLGYGMAGSLLLGIGAVFTAVGTLRLLQAWGPLDGHWSWVPYPVVALGLGLVAFLALWRIGRAPTAR